MHNTLIILWCSYFAQLYDRTCYKLSLICSNRVIEIFQRGRNMRRKIVGMFVLTLLITTILPITESVIAGDEKNPELEDRIRDVRFTGYLLFWPQVFFKHIDIVSAWFYEESENLDCLYLSLKLRELEEKTETLEAIYSVSWVYKNSTYSATVKIHPDGIAYGGFYVCKYLGNDNYEDYYYCDGTLDVESNIITWEIQKSKIGNPQHGDLLTEPFAYTDNRFTEESGRPRIDLFKDLSWNAKIRKDYVIQY